MHRIVETGLNAAAEIAVAYTAFHIVPGGFAEKATAAAISYAAMRLGEPVAKYVAKIASKPEQKTVVPAAPAAPEWTAPESKPHSPYAAIWGQSGQEYQPGSNRLAAQNASAKERERFKKVGLEAMKKAPKPPGR